VRLAWLLLFVSCAALAHVADFAFDPHPGERVPADLRFREAALAGYLGGRPIVLVLGYGGCVNLCGTTLMSTALALQRAGLRADRDYTALFVSIDPRDEAAPPERPGWHVLTGANSAARLARSVGFNFAFDKESGEFAHPAGFVVLTPEGTVARYFEGVGFDPGELRAALLDASRGKTAGPIERVLLLCFHDPVQGRHTGAVMLALRAAGIAFLALLGLFAWRRLR
jgi:protein SCO1/2